MSKSIVKVTDYHYYNADGELKYIKRRTDYSDGSKIFIFCKPDGTTGIKDFERYLYNLPAVVKAEVIYFVEGEKCAEALIKQGYVATTLDCGAGSPWKDEYTEFVKNKKVIIIPDNDNPGHNYARNIKKHIPWATIKELTDVAEKEDVYDWLEKGHTVEEIIELPDSALMENEDNGDKNSKYSLDRRQQSAVLLDIIYDTKAELFLNENNDAFIEIPVKQHKEIYNLNGAEFALWAQRLFYTNTEKALAKESLKQAVAILTAETKFGNSKIYTLSTRVARKGDDFFYDLTNKDWSGVKINTDGWTVIQDVPKLFRRYTHQIPQVIPQTGGELSKIFDYINMTEYKALFICWLVSCYVPDIPHAMPIFHGEKGAAKSTACVLLKRLIDPFAGDTLQLTKSEKSLIINLQQHYFLPFDNVSAINNNTSDTLCRAITGGAVQQRKLYTNDEDCIFTFKRCIAINGISNVANRSDLLDRSILFELQRVGENQRRELQDIYNSFEADRPLLLGAIFDILVKAMKIYPTVKLDKLTRMADFCRWGYAIAEVVFGNGEIFLQEYKSNQATQNLEAINSDSVAYLIMEFMRGKTTWTKRVSAFFNDIKAEAEKHGMNPNSKSMPQAPNSLSRRIKAVKSNLEAVGITFEISEKRSDGNYITLHNKNKSSLPSYNPKNSNANGNSCGGDITIPNGDLLTAPTKENTVSTNYEKDEEVVF